MPAKEAEGLPSLCSALSNEEDTRTSTPFAFWRERRKSSLLHVVSIAEKSRNMCWHF